MKTSPFSIWLNAARPKTLPLALASIMTGSVLAYWNNHASFTITLMAFITATLLQILSNLANDYGDAVKGTDNEDRLGPQRAMQTGLVTQETMKKAIGINIVLTIISGLILVFSSLHQTMDIIGFIALGLLAIGAAIAYTMGDKPYGYRGLGDISVFIFFGLLGVAGTYYLHTGHLSSALFLPATACGLLAVAVLNINNLRDIENDEACGKMTLVVRMGANWGRKYHAVLMAVSFICLAVFSATQIHSLTGWLFLAIAPFVFNHVMSVMRAPNGEAIRPMMGTVVQCALFTNVLFAVGLYLSV
ncbi:1,4-dihydroxy-2-naphthoate polyprenyltransferase [Aliivibrio fischeri]|uniref:1,4-dihydroxy-2-naphthoate polyprenyltransferase n=1 Tax=Aliivibrio fischeri TaxID=668 RepID=UPI00064BECD7|nr:1,4-dihydroxy-2-naphthoate polyprenyltransferase [Aliivibrio fischeri]KLU78847.1 1,4-dihydroxy-2-naphthoate octaprenyltransferase [Aliivibrio fischeri]MCE7536837.1 1,4-dihydroxy-2-naphthoate polyprenyltransferase [Aliivibrio fischeri]MCE7560447.1 1,4-dihydroxy-2-naphthoate polyprenyltransferase [Aliivibrio fischeri]MCE7578026.1 1,4-dihydroxy-2-naphthoate polyprenyltransferase [Aliivibrio fischeri]MCE7590414.1 1,4-dihydroxy-2-naphthoate polyprenyltransferase [Aliivibrio fischeri]